MIRTSCVVVNLVITEFVRKTVLCLEYSQGLVFQSFLYRCWQACKKTYSQGFLYFLFLARAGGLGPNIYWACHIRAFGQRFEPGFRRASSLGQLGPSPAHNNWADKLQTLGIFFTPLGVGNFIQMSRTKSYESSM